MFTNSLLKFTVLLFCVTPAWTAQQTYRARTGFYGPCGEVDVARPRLRWEIWSEQGLEVTASEISLNGKKVNAKYDPTERAVEYQPSSPLAPGEYQVECRVTFVGKAVFKQAWQTRVSAKALDSLDAPSPQQQKAVDVVNRLRQALNLPFMEMDDTLNAASVRHSEYMHLNRETTHEQRRGAPGFFGETGPERLARYGWGGTSWEVVSGGDKATIDAIQNLYDAPYHRRPFLQPGTVPFGFGLVGAHTTMEFGDSKVDGVIVSPGDGQTNVPRLWMGGEIPDPLRIFPGAEAPVGYPIVVQVFQKGAKGLSGVQATLSTNGKPVPIYLSTPANDPELDSGLFIFPKASLKPNTKYTATISGRDAAGNPIDRTWSFTTGA